MLDIREYIIPQSLEDAAALVRKSPANRIVGGGCWLRMERRPYGTWVDLSALGLDQIHAEDGWVQIGSGCTLRMLEVSELLRDTFGSCFADCVSSIVGVQFRNCATVGGSVYGRFGFSDLCTLLLSLEADVLLHSRGAVPMEEFLRTPRHGERDLLLGVRIPQDGRRAAFAAFRRTATDLPVLNTAVSVSGASWRIAVGARPAAAALARQAGARLASGAAPAEAACTASEELRFGDNMRGSGAYRKALCRVLVAQCAGRLKEGLR